MSQLIDDAGKVKASYGYDAYGGTDAPPGDKEGLTSGDTNSLAPLNPMGVLEAVIQPYKEDIAAGNDARAAGRAVFDVSTLLISGGASGTSKAGTTLKAASVPTATAKAVPGPGARFLSNASGEVLDMSRVTIPEGKYGYLLKNPGKARIFRESLGFDEAGLDTALRSHLTTNFGHASRSVPMTGGGTKFTVGGPITGPSGQTWNIATVWGVDVDGTVRLITATP